MARRVEIDAVYHGSKMPLGKLHTAASRWGHGGLYTIPVPARRSYPYLYRLTGPFVTYFIEAREVGSWPILMGFGGDQDFNDLLRELGPAAGLPGDPPWRLPPGVYGF